MTSPQRKPIYDDAEVTEKPASSSSLINILPITRSDNDTSAPEQHTKPRGPSPTDRLAGHIGRARLFIYQHAVSAEDKVNQTVNSAFHLEDSFTRTLTSLAPARETGERLMPGAIYVLVASMAGTILTRNRNILLRAAGPLALGIGAGWVVLPHTMRNVSDLAWEFEKKVPAVAQTHLQISETVRRGASFARVHGEVGARYVDDKVTDAREAVEDWVKQGK